MKAARQLTAILVAAVSIVASFVVVGLAFKKSSTAGLCGAGVWILLVLIGGGLGRLTVEKPDLQTGIWFVKYLGLWGGESWPRFGATIGGSGAALSLVVYVFVLKLFTVDVECAEAKSVRYPEFLTAPQQAECQDAVFVT